MNSYQELLKKFEYVMVNCLGSEVYINHIGLCITSSYSGNVLPMNFSIWQKGKINNSLLKEAIIKAVKIHGNEYLKLMQSEFSFAFDKSFNNNYYASEYDKIYDAKEYLASTMHLYKFYDELNIKYDKEELKRINRIANRKTS